MGNEKNKNKKTSAPKPPSYSEKALKKNSEVLLTTTETIPGYDIVEIHGTIHGTYSTSKTPPSFFRKQSDEGEFTGFTEQTIIARDRAIERIIASTQSVGANAACGMKIDIEHGQFEVYANCNATAITIVRKQPLSKLLI